MLHTSYAKTVLPILRRVRGMLLPYYGNVEFQEKRSHKRFEQVTKLDLTVERHLKAELAKAYSDIPFVGEEEGGDRSAARFWLADPIDGTDHFIRGLPFCTTMLALVENGAVAFSAIYDFVNDALYAAERGRGATANGKPIRVAERTLRQSRIDWSANLEDAENLKRFLMLQKKTYTFHVGPSGYVCALIASGKIDGLVYSSSAYNDYDIAPGTFLIKEAGGVVANIGSREYDYRNLNFIAANPLVFRELTEGADAIFPIQSRHEQYLDKL